MAEPTEPGFRVVDSFSRIVRLGEGLAASGRLSERAMVRTLAALKICRRIMDRHRVTRVRCVATEACRRAANGPEFIRRVRRSTGIDLEVLGHDEEARLAMLGCLPLIDPDADQLLMLDIGGGSTEIMWLDRREPLNGREPGYTLSMPLGVVTLSESFGGGTDPRSYARMVTHAAEQLAEADRLPASARSAGRPAPADAGHLGHRHHAGGGASRPAPLRSAQGRRHLAAVRGDPVGRRASCASWTMPGGPRIRASGSTAPTSWWPAAPSSTRSIAAGRSSSCRSRIAACARAS